MKGSKLPPIWKAPKLYYRLWQIKYGNWDMNDAQYASPSIPRELPRARRFLQHSVSLLLISPPFYYIVHFVLSFRLCLNFIIAILFADCTAYKLNSDVLIYRLKRFALS